MSDPNPADVKLINGAARTVRELFTGRKYGLDYYQREYSWTDANVTELIDDLSTSFLEDYHENDYRRKIASYRPYFLGPVVTSAVGGIRYLVDGQQRLTTLTLLLIHLNHMGKKVEGAQDLASLVFSEQYGEKTFNINIDERKDVMRAILGGTTFDSTDQSKSVQNIWDRYQDIVALYPDALKDSTLPYFCDWLLERVVLVEIGTTDKNMALEVFETMNDRGLRLSNTDMLKGFLLARMGEPETEAANKLWRSQITALTDLAKNAESDFLKNWLRGKYANTIRERKKDAAPRDFDRIGTAFHKWVRDNQKAIGLSSADDYAKLVNHDFKRMSHRYIHLLKVSHCLEAGWEHVYYNAVAGFTLQYLPIMAAVTPDDDQDTFQEKTRMIAAFLDVFVARRMVNFRNFGYSTVVYTIFNLARDVRDKDLDTLREILADRIADLDESFDGIANFGLTQRNTSHIRYLLARMTAWIEGECGNGVGFAEYVNRRRKDPFEVEHIWADMYDRHTCEFTNPHDFADQRNQFGGLLLLPKSFNASYGNKKCEVKLPHYFGQNVLAASLHPRAYENNPSFEKFREETGLPFKYHRKFKKSDIEERQQLYRQICEQVWSPERLGLDGGNPSTKESKESRNAFYGIGLADLLATELLIPEERLRGVRSGKEYWAAVTSDGKIRVGNGSVFNALSGAGRKLTGKSINGWTFWQVYRDGNWHELATIRREYLETSAAD
ncbi:MAG: DUF262 domain-containing protein [Bacteroidetes bacterium]|nr:DUF262 domain-containing protein [Bacteroidota bacterium]